MAFARLRGHAMSEKQTFGILKEKSVKRFNELRGLPTHFGKQRKSRQYLR